MEKIQCAKWPLPNLTYQPAGITYLTQWVILALILMGISIQSAAQEQQFALQFDGTDDFVTFSHNDKLNINAVTIEMWIYWEATSTAATQFLIGKDFEQLEIHTGYQNDQLHYVENALRFIPTPGVYFDTPANVISRKQWHHIAFIYDPSNSLHKCYINGKETSLTKRGLNPETTAISTSAEPLLLSKRSTNDMLYQGRMDEIRIWNTVRTEAEINSNMYRELDPQTGLIAYYKMSGGSGPALDDNSGNGINGIITGAGWKVSGAFAGARKAISLNGTDSFGKVINGAALQPSEALTLEAMVKINSSSGTYQFIIDNGFATNDQHGGYTLGTDGTRFRTWASNGTARAIVLSDTPFELDRWYHVASVFDGHALTLYVNGRISAKGNLTGAVKYDRVNDSPDYGLNLGRYKDDNEEFFADMVIDEVRIWGVSRTPSQIRSTMMTSLKGNETGLMAYYRFDNDNNSIAYDITTNASNATLHNATAVISGAFTSWLGSENSQWNNAANWSDGVPGVSSNAGIYKWDGAFNTEIYGATSVNNLLIESQTPVILSSDLFLNGNLIISGNGRINQSKSAKLTITKSLIMDKNGSGGIKIE